MTTFASDKAIPLLEKLSQDASSPPYTMNKAIRALNAIKGMEGSK
jgi:hypothetical protein